MVLLKGRLGLEGPDETSRLLKVLGLQEKCVSLLYGVIRFGTGGTEHLDLSQFRTTYLAIPGGAYMSATLACNDLFDGLHGRANGEHQPNGRAPVRSARIRFVYKYATQLELAQLRFLKKCSTRFD